MINSNAYSYINVLEKAVNIFFKKKYLWDNNLIKESVYVLGKVKKILNMNKIELFFENYGTDNKVKATEIFVNLFDLQNVNKNNLARFDTIENGLAGIALVNYLEGKTEKANKIASKILEHISNERSRYMKVDGYSSVGFANGTLGIAYLLLSIVEEHTRIPLIEVSVNYD